LKGKALTKWQIFQKKLQNLQNHHSVQGLWLMVQGEFVTFANKINQYPKLFFI